MPVKYKSFNATTVPLKGSNLIEASAGTGKTYSIAILVLRLILEKRISVKDILMVTFTKAAVAELEDRVRRFIRKAEKAASGNAIDDATIAELVNNAVQKLGQEAIQRLLREAVLFFDETSVLTIHSFCQNALTEFAFETKQVFGADTLQDASQVLEDEVNEFWRTHITILPVDLLKLVVEKLDRSVLTSIIKSHLGGKQFAAYELGKSYCSSADDHDAWLKQLEALKAKQEELRKCLIEHVINNHQKLAAACETDGNARRYVLPLINEPHAFLNYIANKRSSGYITKLFAPILAQLDACNEPAEEVQAILKQVRTNLICLAIQECKNGIESYKRRRNLMTFDDMIVNLHNAIMSANADKLVEALRKKYKAVFVDEFQDTDRLQFDIFNKAFGKNHLLFYIGDPKQSIYAFRKADIFTYFEARRSVSSLYEMNNNYRSSVPLIKAMNSLFGIEDPFYFNNTDDATHSINYIPVQSPEPNHKGILTQSAQPVVPITITNLENKGQICDALIAQVVALLSKEQEFGISKEGNVRRLKANDIGILVRSNFEGADIKAALSAKGIPAVTIGDNKVLDSEEARYLWYLLTGIENPSASTINRALLSPFTGFNRHHLLRLDEERVLELFKTYRSIWEESGVYTALMRFVADFGVRNVLLQHNTENGERIIANLYQLIEIVHKVQSQKSLSPIEVIAWLKRGIDGLETEGDEYEQRIESDEDAVKIVTIHKSKGLEYNIVLAPYLDMMVKERDTCSFRNPNTGEYFSVDSDSLTEEQREWWYSQEEQENRRLIYVAITRAAYKCFIYKNVSKNSNDSSLLPFVQQVTANTLIDVAAALQVPEGYRYNSSDVISLSEPSKAENFVLQNAGWRRLSYTGLAAKADAIPRPASASHKNEYDQFIFHQLIKGQLTGNMLHYILERIDFTNSHRWSKVIEDAIKLYAPKQKELYSKMLLQLVEHITSAGLCVGDETFSLSAVSMKHRLAEFEFDFLVDEFMPRELNRFSEELQISVKQLDAAEGILNGKMDLFFQHAGKFYILDWKSNYLGDRLSDYTPEKVAAAMNDNNYHLQYLIYTVAARKYLQGRLGDAFDYERDFGGVVYLFLRGVRSNADTGIFTTKPSLELIERLEQMLAATPAEMVG